MASKAELWVQLQNAIKILDSTLGFGISNTPNFATLQDTLQNLLEGANTQATATALASFRTNLAALCNSSNIIQSIMLELAKIGYNSRATSVTVALDDIFDGMVALSETVKNRVWTRGVIAVGGSNVGLGTVYRLTKDKTNGEIELGNYTGGITKIECMSDKNTGAPSGSEQFAVYGSGISSADVLDFAVNTAPAGSITLTATKAEDGKLSNSSFETVSGTAGAEIWTGWTVDATKAVSNSTIYYRSPTIYNTSKSIELTASTTITQYLSDFASKIDQTRPVFLIVRYYRKTSCDGTLQLRLGSQTSSALTLTGKSNATWYDEILAVDSKCWYSVFKEDNSSKGVRVEAILASRTTGSLLIDCIILTQPVLYDGVYYLVTAGTNDYLKSDYFTFTDSVSNTGRIQTTLSRLYGKYLPHTSGSPTYADV